MKKSTLKSKLSLVIVCMLHIYLTHSAFAQIPNGKYSNYIGWGISLGTSTVHYTRLGLMYSTSYTHRFSDDIALDAGVSITQQSYRTTRPFPYSDAQRSQVAIYGDATLMFTIGRINASDLTIGIGPSIQYLDGFSSSYLHNFDPSLPVSPRNIFFQQIIDAYSLGGNLKIDYNIPIRDSNCEIVIRAQGHFFAVPFAGVVEAPPSRISTAPLQYGGWSARLGVFLRFGV